MKNLYKLVDEETAKLAKNGIVSFSRPYIEFPGSEGKIANFFDRFSEKYEKLGENIKPSKKDLEKIEAWIQIYKETYNFGNISDENLNTELQVIFCAIENAYCGYFTKNNLFEKKKLQDFLNLNRLKNKTMVMQVNINSFSHSHWRTTDLNESFFPFDGNKDDFDDYNGFMHMHNIKYDDVFGDCKRMLAIFNKKEMRVISDWFILLKDKNKWQNEKRAMLLLRSLNKNCSTIACNKINFKNRTDNTLPEKVFWNIIDAINYSYLGNRYIKVKVGKENIKLKNINEILY